MKIRILAIDAGNEPHAIRAVAESFGHLVEVVWIGSKAQMLCELGADTDSDMFVISGHGELRGFCMPEVTPSLQISTNDNYIEPADLTKVGALPRVVISTACCTGTQAFADIFMKAGALRYIAPPEYPDASTVLMYVINVLYQAVASCKSDTKLKVEDLLLEQDCEISVFNEISG